MKLYELPRNSPLRVVLAQDGAIDDAKFFHIDGMFSYCETSDGRLFHLSASQEVELVNGRYELK